MSLTPLVGLSLVSPSQATPEPTGVELSEFPVRDAPTEVGVLEVKGHGALAPVSPEEEFDLRTIAEGFDLELGEVLKRTRGSIAFLDVVAGIRRNFPDVFVAAGEPSLQEKEPGTFWVETTAPPSEAMIEVLRSLPVDVEVRYGAPANALEIEAASQAVTEAIPETREVSAIRAGYALRERVLKVEYAPASDAAAAEISTALNAAVANALNAKGALPLPIRTVANANLAKMSRHTTVQGGRPLRNHLGAAKCTAGFTGKRANKGVITAWHCGPLRYGYNNGVLSRYPVTPDTDYQLYDIEFLRTVKPNGHTTNRQFRATGRDSSDDRIVHSVANPAWLSSVCHWGEQTGYSCAYVLVVDRCLVIRGTMSCGVDRTTKGPQRCRSVGGDSGGPWFLGTGARGIHLGSSDTYCYFTRIGEVDEHGLNVEVLQQ